MADRTRRSLLVSGAAWAGASVLGNPLSAALAADISRRTTRFDYDRLIADARRLARLPYTEPVPRYGDLLDDIGYQTFMGIRTRPGHGLWLGTDLAFSLEFFHLNNNTRSPVEINIVDHGQARRLTYDPRMFVYPDSTLAARLPDDLGYGGFRLYDHRSDNREWLAFKGASYFRSPGTANQYGMSARGVAINTGDRHHRVFSSFHAILAVQASARRRRDHDLRAA